MESLQDDLPGVSDKVCLFSESFRVIEGKILVGNASLSALSVVCKHSNTYFLAAYNEDQANHWNPDSSLFSSKQCAFKTKVSQ